MGTRLFLSLSVAWLASSGVALACRSAPDFDAADVRAARETFTGQCSACHAAPDLDFAVERAWLERVRATG